MKRIIVVLFLFSLNSCYLNDDFIESISMEVIERGILVPIAFTSDGAIVEVVVFNDDLYNQIYKKHYSHYPTYAEFLREVFKGQLIIDSKYEIYKEHSINSSSKLFREYNEEGIDYIIEKYLIGQNHVLIYNGKLEWKDWGALIKIMFSEKYYPLNDEYRREISFLKELPKE